MKTSVRAGWVFAAGSAVVLSAGVSAAATFTWLGAPASANWNEADANWSGAGPVWASAATNSAVFGASATTALTADAVTLQHLTFSADGYTVGGGPLLMYGSPTVDAGVTATLAAPVTNVGVWAKAGAGTLALAPGANATNTLYALKAAVGTVHVTDGTTLVTQSGSNPESGPAFWVTGGTLVMGGGTLKTTGGAYARVSEYGTLLITNGLVDLSGNAELLNGHNTPGVTTVSGGGTLQVQALRISQNTSPAAATVINVNTGGTIRLKNFNLDASSARNGTVNFNGGTLVALDTVNQVDLLGTTNPNWRNILVNVLAGGAIIDNNGCNITLRQNLRGAPGDGGLTKLNGGILYVRGTNTFTGGTALRGGVFNIIRDHNLGAVPAAPETNLLFLANSTLQSSESHALERNRTIWITNAVTASVDTQGHTQTIRGAIVGAETNTVLVKSGGTGTLVLDPGADSGVNVGTLRCQNGTLAVLSGTNFVTAPNRGQNQPGVWISGGTLLVGGGLLKATAPMFINIDGGALVVTNGYADFRVQSEILNAIGTPGRTTVSGSGVLECQLMRISQYAGSPAGNPSNAVVNVNTGGVLRVTRFYIDVGATQKGTVNLNGGTVASRGSTADFLGTATALAGNNNDKWLTNIFVNVLEGGAIFDFAQDNYIKQPLYGAVPNDGGLTKRGAGLMLLANTNTFAGGTRVEAGTLRLNVNHTLLPGTAAAVWSNAVLDVNGRVQALSSLGGGGTVTNNAQLAVAGEIAPGDAGAFGTLTLAAPCALSGTLTVDVSPDGAGDRLHVGGALDLSTLSLNVAETSALNREHRYVVATSAGPLSGAFSSHNLPPRWRLKVDVVNRQVYLTYDFGTLILVQ